MNTVYFSAQFDSSASDPYHCPQSQAEVAFAGRSNAGKSSAINTITRNRKLARTSKTPGRTQLINHFSLGDQRFLVDLPGYGYASSIQVAPKGLESGDATLPRQASKPARSCTGHGYPASVNRQ